MLSQTITILLIINSIATVVLILNQNDSVKDTTTTANTALSNPLENITWLTVFFELLLLLINNKINEF